MNGSSYASRLAAGFGLLAQSCPDECCCDSDCDSELLNKVPSEETNDPENGFYYNVKNIREDT